MLNTNFADAGFSAQKASENVWWPGSARTRWGSFSAPPDPLAAKKGGRGRVRGGQEVGERGEGKGQGQGEWQWLGKGERGRDRGRERIRG